MSANKNGNAPVKASVKRMHRPERLEMVDNGSVKIAMFWARLGIWMY